MFVYSLLIYKYIVGKKILVTILYSQLLAMLPKIRGNRKAPEKFSVLRVILQQAFLPLASANEM